MLLLSKIKVAVVVVGHLQQLGFTRLIYVLEAILMGYLNKVLYNVQITMLRIIGLVIAQVVILKTLYIIMELLEES